MAEYVTVVPAYGRDYTSQAKVAADYFAGKDFTVVDFFSPWNGSKVNKADAEREGIILSIRYNKQQRIVNSDTLKRPKA